MENSFSEAEKIYFYTLIDKNMAAVFSSLKSEEF